MRIRLKMSPAKIAKFDKSIQNGRKFQFSPIIFGDIGRNRVSRRQQTLDSVESHLNASKIKAVTNVSWNVNFTEVRKFI
jgi:hypothetical protein